MKTLISVALCVGPLIGYGQDKLQKTEFMTNTKALTCKLTTPELQQRKKTVIAKLKSIVFEKVETELGFKYKFDGSDSTLDLLNDFIKTERLCCDFFVFTLTASNEEQSVWMELSGPEGTKEFIKHEIEF